MSKADMEEPFVVQYYSTAPVEPRRKWFSVDTCCSYDACIETAKSHRDWLKERWTEELQGLEYRAIDLRTHTFMRIELKGE